MRLFKMAGFGAGVGLMMAFVMLPRNGPSPRGALPRHPLVGTWRLVDTEPFTLMTLRGNGTWRMKEGKRNAGGTWQEPKPGRVVFQIIQGKGGEMSYTWTLEEGRLQLTDKNGDWSYLQRVD